MYCATLLIKAEVSYLQLFYFIIMLALQSRVQIIQGSNMHNSYYQYIGKKGKIISIAGFHTSNDNILYNVELDGHVEVITFNHRFIIADPEIRIIIDSIFINLDKLEKRYENIR